jgi:hypothetical protein
MAQDKSRWDELKPKSSGGAFGYGLTKKQFDSATTGEHLRRALTFGTFGSGAKREDFANTMGMLTKEQKSMVAKGGALNRMFHMAIPAATAFGLGSTIMEGGDGMDYMADVAAPEVGAFAGWRTGKSMGFAVGKATGMRTGAKFLTGVAGGVAGGVVGGAIAMGIADTIRSSADSNNYVKQLGGKANNVDLKMDFAQNESTISHLTHRRRTMDKLSKSALNDRGQVMGNEAMILKGIM